MTKCPECSSSVSDLAAACPHCGYPIQQVPNTPPSPALDEAIHWNERPLTEAGEAELRRIPNPRERMKARQNAWRIAQQGNATPGPPATKSSPEAQNVFGRLLMTAFALWWGYNAIQMFSCEFVSWGGRTAFCTSSSGYPSGAVTGGAILVVVVLVLGWLWVWPFARQPRSSERRSGCFRIWAIGTALWTLMFIVLIVAGIYSWLTGG